MAFNFKLFFQLLYYSLFKSKNTHSRLTFKRLTTLAFWFIFMPTHQLFTWLCFLLDEIFYRGYRKQEVKEPIFIIGNFRSGSTLLQRLLVKDDQFTSMHTWEIYVCPSIVQRKIWHFLSAVDNKLFGGVIHKLLDKFDEKNLRSIPMHKVSLPEADEDEGVLLYNWTSSFLIFIFPFLEVHPPHFYFDTQATEKEKRISMEFYYRIIQRHVYYYGGRRYMTKNPAFSAKIESLRQYFPDAKFIYLVRNPVDMLASQTSFFTYIWRRFNNLLEPYPFNDFILDFTKFWYTYPLEKLSELPDSEYLILKYREVVENLGDSVGEIYNKFEVPMTPPFKQVLAEAVEEAAHYKSKHDYSLVEMGYTPEQVYNHYQDTFERFNFALDGKAMVAKVTKQQAVID